jgi:hypothetical protein
MKRAAYLLQPENPSYMAKGEYIKAQITDKGLADGGVITHEDVMEGRVAGLQGAVVVIADAYNLHKVESTDLCRALEDSNVIAAPSVLRAHEADHAAGKGITILLPEAQQADFTTHIEKGKVIVVDQVSAAAVPHALEDLRQEDGGAELAQKFQSVVTGFDKWSFLYPPGHFTRPDKSEGKDELTRKDVDDVVALIQDSAREETLGVIVIGGGRVALDVLQGLKTVFASHANVVVASQQDYKADLVSALTQLSAKAQRKPLEIKIDALAGTTLKVATSAGWGNIGLISSERMFAPENVKRFKQIIDHHRQYGGRDVFHIGNVQEGDKARLMAALKQTQETPASSAPQLATALHAYLSDRGLLPDAFTKAPSGPQPL